MHGHMNVKFVNAKQAKETYQYGDTRENYTKQRPQYGITKFAEEIHPGPARKMFTNLYGI